MSTNESRRRFLQTSGLGIGWLAAMDLWAADSLAPKPAPWPSQAKRVISLFMQGGPSQMDTFDPKPLLAKLHGKHPPASFGDEDFQNGKFKDSIVLGSRRTFARHGQS